MNAASSVMFSGKNCGFGKKHFYAATALMVSVCGAMVFATNAQAQMASNNNDPIQVNAASVDFQPQNNMTIISGNAEIVQGNAVLRAPGFKIYYGAQGTAQSGKVQKVYSEGVTYYVTPTEKIRGDKAFYDAVNNTIIFTGNVILNQGKSVATGYELRVNTITKQSQLKSSGGRVKAVLFPQDQNIAKSHK